MLNEEVIRNFFNCYQIQDRLGMQSCLDENVTFSDFGFDLIRGKQVQAMWHWFCMGWDRKEPVPLYFEDRRESVDVPEFKIVKSSNDIVIAKYRVKYRYGKRPIDYKIESHFKLQNGRIIEHKDLKSISDFEFARMAVGFPKALLALTPLFRNKVRDSLGKKLKKFMDDFGY